MIAIENATNRLMDGHQNFGPHLDLLTQVSQQQEQAIYEELRHRVDGFAAYILEWMQVGGPTYIEGWPELHEYIYGRG